MKEQIIFYGNQKSGTTAIAKLFAERVGLTYSNDPLYNVDKGRSIILRFLLRFPGALPLFVRLSKVTFKGDVVKDPDFSFMLSSVRAAYRPTKEVFVCRDPRDNIRSILNRLGIDGRVTSEAVALRDLKGGNRHWLEVMNGFKDFYGGTNVIERLAYRCKANFDTYMSNSDTMYLARYEDFLSGKVEFIDDLADRLSIDMKESIDGIVDKQYQPKGDNSLSYIQFFGEKNLNAINSICAEEMGFLGYSL